MSRILNVLAVACVVVLVASILTSSRLSAQVQPPEVEWEKTYGGTGRDEALSVQQTTDGGYVVTGATNSFGAGRNDVYLLKTDSQGSLVWHHWYGGANSDSGSSVRQTSDGGFIVVGYTRSFGAGGEDVYLLKTDAAGTLQWQTTFGGASDDAGVFVQQTSDGGYIVVGSTTSFGAGYYDIYLIKTDANGTVSTGWSKTYGGANYDVGLFVQPTTDGGYLVAGKTGPSHHTYAAALFKTDAEGNLALGWPITLSGTAGVTAVQPTRDGGYIVMGEIFVSGAGNDAYLLKTDAQGNIAPGWPKTFGGVDYDAGSSVQQTADGGYIVAGYTTSFGTGLADVYLLKTDAEGTLRWQQTFGRVNSDFGTSVQQTADGGFIVAGYTNSFGAGDSDVYLIKLYPERLPLPPESPTNLTVQLVTPTVTQLIWVDTSDNETKFVVERHRGICGWKFLADVLANAQTYFDQLAPSGERPCYRVSAVGAAGTSTPSNPACISTPPADQQQLLIFDPDVSPSAWVSVGPCTKTFDERLGTVVITHGFTPPPCDPIGVKDTWLALAKGISQRMSNNVNVLFWDWVPNSCQLEPILNGVKREASLLSVTLKRLFPLDYSGPLHCMGHSYGSYLVTVCAEFLAQSGRPVRTDQLTLWDPPQGFPFPYPSNLGDFTAYVRDLRTRGTVVELYDGCFNESGYGVDWWVSTPVGSQGIFFGCHLVYEWYVDTVSGVGDPTLYRMDNGQKITLGGTVGFGTSPLLLDTARQPQGDVCPAGVTQVYVYYLEGSPLRPEPVFYQADACPRSPVPVQKGTPDLTDGIIIPEVWCGSFGRSRVILCTVVSGQGGGAQADALSSRYELPLAMEADVTHLSFQYQLTEVLSASTLSVLWDSAITHDGIEVAAQDQVILDHAVDSGLLDIRSWAGQSGTLTLRLQSTGPGTVAQVDSLRFWQVATGDIILAQFLRGDCNTDRAVNLSDPIDSLNVLFRGGAPPSCEDACDTNDDGEFDISDAVFTLIRLFLGGEPTFPTPYPNPGLDLSLDRLDCAKYPSSDG